MKISRNWLSEYVALENRSAEDLAEILTMGGLEVDAIEHTGPSLDGVVVGRVERVRAHPNADRLVLCDVTLGPDDRDTHNGTGSDAFPSAETKQIACGAPNVAAGQHVPVATVGTQLMLPDRDVGNGTRKPVTIEAVELRGARSEGMICSAHELGIGPDASGILVLDESAPVGQPFGDYLAARGSAPSDAVLNIDLTPNRPDAASHLGVARDLAALTRQRLERPDVALPEEGGETAEALTVHIEDPTACPRYVGLLVRGVAVRESPAWLKTRLAAIGLQPRNVVVDVTNFVMHECGQPLHAFDFSKIKEGTIAARPLAENISFTTLDGTEREVPAGTLMICDAERPVAIAGVMGGANSEVSAETTEVLIESAYFNPSHIRRAAKALDLATDASYRFERGVSTDGQDWAAARAAHLIADLTGAEVAGGLVDAHPAPPSPTTITLRPARANALLGTDLSSEAMQDLLVSVGVQPGGEGPAPSGETLRFTAPPFRPDLTREVDLIEEIARLYGYDRIPAPAHVPLPARPPREAPGRRLRRRVRTLLSGMGLREIQTNSMLPAAKARRFLGPADETAADPVRTLKPISEAMAALRPRLLPGALEATRFNRNRGQEGLRFFEFGHVFRRSTRSSGGGPVPGYDEHEALLLTLSGPAQVTGWSTTARAVDFYDLKGVVERLLDYLRLDGAVMEPFGEGPDPNFAYGLRLTTAERTPLGVAGKVTDDVAAAFDLEQELFAAELRWETLVEAAAPALVRRYRPPRRFPAVERDLAVVVDETVPAGAVRHTIERAGTTLLESTRLFDLYAGEGIAEGRKSLAFALRFAADRTLEDEEVDDEVRRIVSLLEEEHDATLRQ